MTLTLLSILLCVEVIESRSIPLTNDERGNPFYFFPYALHSDSKEMAFPKDWPFSDQTLNYITIILGTIVLILVIIFFCCVCFYICQTHFNEVLVVTPSELIAIGAKPSILRAARITPSDLKKSGASPEQIQKLGFTEINQEEMTKSDIKPNEESTSLAVNSKETESKAEDNKSNESIGSTISATRSSLMSANAELMDEKLKDKPKKSTASDKKSEQTKSSTAKTLLEKEVQKTDNADISGNTGGRS